jgi:hypothetical protein
MIRTEDKKTMVFEEQISAFLDGALTAGEETEFLHILSVSPEKRELFHSYLGVHNAMVADMRHTAVPARLDAAVFAAAGIAGAGTATATAAGAAPGAAAGAAAGWTAGKITAAILTGLALLTGGYFAGSMMSTGDLNDADRTARIETRERTAGETHPQSAETGALTIGSTENGTGGMHAAGRDEGALTGTPRERIVYRNVYITRVDTLILPAAQASVQRTQVFDTVYVAQAEPRIPERDVVYIEGVREQQPRPSLPGNIEVELLSEHSGTYPYIDYNAIGASRNQQHLSVQASYALNEHHALGIMAGQRAYSLEYYEVVGDSMYMFQEQPTYFYGGGFYRYSLPLFAGVTPEFQVQLGATQLGPLLGSRLAVRLSPFQHLSFMVGVNGSMLVYGYKQQLFTSQTLGFLYGLQYRF